MRKNAGSEKTKAWATFGQPNRIQKTRQPQRMKICAGARSWPILLRQHYGCAGFALVAGVNLELERVQAFPTGAGDDDLEQVPARKGFHRGNARHPKDIVPHAFPVVAVVGMVNGLLNERRYRRGHGDMHAREVLGGDRGQVAAGRINNDAVGDGLCTGVNGNDHEAVKRVAGLIDNVAGLRNRITR